MPRSLDLSALKIETETADIVISIRLQPRSSRKGALGVLTGTLKVGVHSPPEKNKANEELIDWLAAFCKIARQNIEIVSGAKSKNKKIRLKDLSQTEFLQRLKGT